MQPSQFNARPLLAFPHAALTGQAVTWRPRTHGTPYVDVIFILALIALYAVTHWLVTGISKLGGPP